MSWIHVDDLARLAVHAAKDNRIHGPVNGVSPNCVRNAEFAEALAKILKVPAFLHVPAFALRAAYGEMADVLLSSTRATPKAALNTGFEWIYPEISDALAQIVSSIPRK
jgi:uncharacterized protein